MIDLSQLQIPDVAAVPEPTQAEVERYWECVITPSYDPVCKLTIWLARRCRELEAEVERLRQWITDQKELLAP